MIQTDKFYKDQTACAKEINFLFKQLRQFHHRMSKQLEDMKHVVISREEVKAWKYGDSGNSPAIKMYTCLHTWGNIDREFINRGLEREIEAQLLADNVGYSEFIQNAFANQWEYLKQFKDSLLLFVNNNEEAHRIIQKLHNPPEKFTKHEFRVGIELDMIHIFYLAELIYYKYDKKYNLFFKDGEFLTREITNPDYIQLNYANANSTAIKTLHDNLIRCTLVACTLEEFAAHFDPFGKVPPSIQWLGSDVQLITWFLGRKLMDANKKVRLYSISLKKIMDAQQLLAHFKPQKESTTHRTLSANYYNSLNRKSFYQAQDFMLTVDQLDLLKT